MREALEPPASPSPDAPRPASQTLFLPPCSCVLRGCCFLVHHGPALPPPPARQSPCPSGLRGCATSPGAFRVPGTGQTSSRPLLSAQCPKALDCGPVTTCRVGAPPEDRGLRGPSCGAWPAGTDSVQGLEGMHCLSSGGGREERTELPGVWARSGREVDRNSAPSLLHSREPAFLPVLGESTTSCICIAVVTPVSEPAGLLSWNGPRPPTGDQVRLNDCP